MLRALGVLFLVLLLAAGLAFGFVKYQDYQAREYVSLAIPAIFKSWDERALDDRTIRELQTPEFKRESGAMLEHFGEILGRLESAEAPEGTFGFGQHTLIGIYEAKAKFEHGDCTIEMRVVRQDHAWRIGYWRVNSDALRHAMPKPGLQTDGSVVLAHGPPEAEREVLKRASGILRLLDDDSPGTCWDEAAPSLQEKASRAEFVAMIREKARALHSKVGEPPERQLVREGFARDLPGSPQGEYAVLEFKSNYPRYQLDERVTLIRQEDRWLLFGYKWQAH